MQGLDLRANELKKEIAMLPKQIAEIEKVLVGHAKKLEADRALLANNLKERKLRDLEIQSQQAKIAKLKDQMTAAKTNEQFKAFQSEIDYCDKEVKKHEDRVIELMELSEPLAVNVKAAEAALAQEKAVVDRHKAAMHERTAVDQKALDTLMAERKVISEGVSRPVLNLFERLSKKFSGNAITDATSGRCTSCHLEIRPQLFQDLRRGSDMLVCENCGRILHYNPPAAVEPDMSGAAARVDPRAGSRVDMS